MLLKRIGCLGELGIQSCCSVRKMKASLSDSSRASPRLATASPVQLVTSVCRLSCNDYNCLGYIHIHDTCLLPYVVLILCFFN